MKQWHVIVLGIIAFIVLYKVAYDGPKGNNKQVATIAVATDAPAPEATDTPKVIITDDWYGFNVVVGHKYHLEEGFIGGADSDSPEEETDTLLGARMAGNRDGIERAYGLPNYRHYGNTNEDSPPKCKISDQDPIEIDKNSSDSLNYNSPEHPIHCTLDDGTDFYATTLSR